LVKTPFELNIFLPHKNNLLLFLKDKLRQLLKETPTLLSLAPSHVSNGGYFLK